MNMNVTRSGFERVKIEVRKSSSESHQRNRLNGSEG
jgi:hypothetical protein